MKGAYIALLIMIVILVLGGKYITESVMATNAALADAIKAAGQATAAAVAARASLAAAETARETAVTTLNNTILKSAEAKASAEIAVENAKIAKAKATLAKVSAVNAVVSAGRARISATGARISATGARTSVAGARAAVAGARVLAAGARTSAADAKRISEEVERISRESKKANDDAKKASRTALFAVIVARAAAHSAANAAVTATTANTTAQSARVAAAASAATAAKASRAAMVTARAVKAGKEWVKYKKKACYWSRHADKWAYVNSAGVVVGQNSSSRGPISASNCQIACDKTPGCTGIEHSPDKYCSLWYDRACDSSAADWHTAGSEDTWTYKTHKESTHEWNKHDWICPPGRNQSRYNIVNSDGTLQENNTGKSINDLKKISVANCQKACHNTPDCIGLTHLKNIGCVLRYAKNTKCPTTTPVKLFHWDSWRWKHDPKYNNVYGSSFDWTYGPIKKWTEHKKKACMRSKHPESWMYVHPDGKLTGDRDISKRRPVSVANCKKVCARTPGCTGIEHSPNKYCSIWINEACSPSENDWRTTTDSKNTWTYDVVKK